MNGRVILVGLLFLLALSFLTVHDTKTQANGNFFSIQIAPNFYAFYYFSVPQVTLGPQEVMVVMYSDQTVTLDIVNDATNTTVYSQTSQGIDTVIYLEPGNYTAYIYNNNPVSASVNLYIAYLPAPVGIADYGVRASGQFVFPYVEKFDAVIGVAKFYSYDVSTIYGTKSTLVLYSTLQVNTLAGSQQYGLFNAVLLTGENGYITCSFDDVIYNYTTFLANMSPLHVSGKGAVNTFSFIPYYYYRTPSSYTSQLPHKLVLVIAVSQGTNEVTVRFGYVNTSSDELVWYDNVTITVPGLESAYLLVDGYNSTGTLLPYDTELVVGGGLGEPPTVFNGLNASLSLLYFNGTFFGPNAVFPFGINVGPSAYNLETVPGSGAYYVTTGYSITLPLTLTQPLGLQLINYTNVTDYGYNVSLTFSIYGGEAPYLINVTFAGYTGSYIAYTPGTYVLSFEANETGQHSVVITAYSLNGQEITKTFPVKVNPPMNLVISSKGETDVGTPFKLNYTLSGGTPPYSVSIYVNGTLQKGETVVFNSPGTYNVTIYARDSVGATISRIVMIHVNPSPGVTIRLSREVTDVGVPIELSYNVTGGTPPYRVTIYVNGTPYSNTSLTLTQPGTYSVQVIVTDSVGGKAVAQQTVVVNPRPTVYLNVNYQGSIFMTNTGASISATASGGTPPYTYYVYLNGREVYSGTQVQDLQLNLSQGTNNITVVVVDSVGSKTSYSLTAVSGYNLLFLVGIAIVVIAVIIALVLVLRK